MADDSLEIQKDAVPFHPCLTPRGMTWFDLNILTPLQQKILNELKIDTARENNKYLAQHPEIRAIIFIFLSAVLKEQPLIKTLGEFAKNFFSRPEAELQKEIDDYLKKRGEPLNKEGNSAVNLKAEPLTRPSSADDSTSVYNKGYYTYFSYTDESSNVEEEWSDSYDFNNFKITSPTDRTYTSTTDIYTPKYYQDSDSYCDAQFTLPNISQIELNDEQYSLEVSTIELTKSYAASLSTLEALFKQTNENVINEINIASEIEQTLSLEVLTDEDEKVKKVDEFIETTNENEKLNQVENTLSKTLERKSASSNKQESSVDIVTKIINDHLLMIIPEN